MEQRSAKGYETQGSRGAWPRPACPAACSRSLPRRPAARGTRPHPERASDMHRAHRRLLPADSCGVRRPVVGSGTRTHPMQGKLGVQGYRQPLCWLRFGA